MMTGEPQIKLKDYRAQNFDFEIDEGVGVITLNRPERKNPLTFSSYAELRDLFRDAVYAEDVKVFILKGAGGNFCSGGDVHDIIGPLISRDMKGLLSFTRMTGDLVKAMRNCPQPIFAAINGICVGAGAIMAMASDLRYASPETKTAFLFTKVGLAGCDMGACAILPRIIGQGRASELLYFGRSMNTEEGKNWGFFNEIFSREELFIKVAELAKKLSNGPTFAHGMTKNQLNMEWNMSLDTAIEAEAQAQAIAMNTKDFERAFHAFVAKEKPVFKGD